MSKPWIWISEEFERLRSEAGSKNYDVHRTAKQCWERWSNVLDPSINSSSFTEDEIRIIYNAWKAEGGKWVRIAKLLKNRSDSSIKNYFNSSLWRAARKINSVIKEALDGKFNIFSVDDEIKERDL